MEFKSTRNNNSIFDELKSRLYTQSVIEKNDAYKKYTLDEELVEAIEISEDDYNFNLFKLDQVAALDNQLLGIRKKFISQKLYIERMEISEKEKLEIILTTACLLNNFGLKITLLHETSLYLLARAMINIDLNNYSNYEILISSHLNNIMALLRNVDKTSIPEKTKIKTK